MELKSNTIHQWLVDQVKWALCEENFKCNEVQCPVWIANTSHFRTVGHCRWHRSCEYQCFADVSGAINRGEFKQTSLLWAELLASTFSLFPFLDHQTRAKAADWLSCHCSACIYDVIRGSCHSCTRCKKRKEQCFTCSENWPEQTLSQKYINICMDVSLQHWR